MTTPSSNVISPSSSIYSSSTIGSSIGRSTSNRSLYRDLTSATSSNSIAALAGGGRKPTSMGRSRQNTTTDYMTGEDLVRTIGSDYQEIQKRALTKWVNSQLKLADDHIDNIETDFKDGRKLLKLLSVVSKEPAPKPEKMNMRIHQLANVAQALSFLEKQLGADSIVDMGNEAIVNGDRKKTLALIFFIMIKYQIQIVLNDHGDDFAQSLLDYSDRHRDGLRVEALSPTNETTTILNGSSAFSAERGTVPTTPIPGSNSLLAARKLGSNYSISSDKQHTSSTESKLALLFWVRIQLEDYIVADIIPSIQDFSRSWRNGLAFCLLIHRHGPDLIPDLFSSHLKDADLTQKQTWHRLLTLAFDLAMEHMNIPKYLDPEDLVDVDYPHEPSVMMYVAEFYKVMTRVQESISKDQRHEIAIRRRTNIAMVTGGIDNLLSTPVDYHSSTDQQRNLDSGMALSDDDESVTSTKKKSKKKAHRVSTLADEDKERLKADLNARLMMQLTGHLPRGVNPLLDQLITIHETVLAFIKTNTRTLDEIPTSFDDADTVAEYLDALEIVEEQMQEESSLLDTARNAKDKLMLPPENADDESIRLTDLQRTQVKNLYDMLLDHWTDFEQLLSTTKCDLLRIESDLVDIEEGTHKYHVEADKIMDRIKELQQLLQQIIPHHIPTSDDPENDDIWHPLDECSGNEQINEIAHTFQQSALAANEQVDTFDSTDWKSYQRFILQFSRVILKQVKTRLEELEHCHQNMLNIKQETLTSSNDFSRALDLISTTKAIGLELETIHKLMDDNNHTTNDAILDLENQINAVRTSIHNTRETFDNLLTNDERLSAFFNKVQQQYEMVRDWVDQVRVWFIEAERIRKWIEVRIDIIHQRNGSADFDPLSDVLTKKAQDNSKVWHDEHVKLGREIDRFDADDMARLRTHVKTLTGVDRGNRDLSPADTSTIEITLTTLNMLNQLTYLLRQRSYMVDMLTLRIHWDDLFGASSQWILDTDHDITEFLKPGQARWISTDDEIGTASNSNSVDSSFDDINTSRRRSPVRAPTIGLMDTEEMIQMLVALESRVIQFDQSTYSDCLDAYQEMEDLHNATLPTHLDTRQSHFEDSFGDLMKRSGFARKVVEQHLALLDVAAQYRQLRDKGESIRISIINSSKSTSTRAKTTARGGNVTDGDESDGDMYGDQVQTFKEDSSQLITYVFSRITYTEPPTYTTLIVGSQDRQDNELANHSIKEAIQGYAMQLAMIAEALENLLASHRRTLSLQQRATLAYEEMMRLIQWLDERREMYKQSWLDMADDSSDDGDNSSGDDSKSDGENNTASIMAKHQRDLDGILARLEQLEESELPRLRKRVTTIENEIDASNSLSIDRSTLVNAIEHLDDSHLKLRQFLDRRTLELSIMGKRQTWEDQLTDALAALDSVAYHLWILVDSIKMHVDLNGDYTDNDDDKAMADLDQQRSEVNQIGELPVLSQNGSYAELETAYQKLGVLPDHLKETQLSVIAKQHDLKQLCIYAQGSSEYKQGLKRMVDETKGAIQQGNYVQEELTRLYALKSSQSIDLDSQPNALGVYLDDTATSDSTSCGASLLQDFKQLVRIVSGKRIQLQLPTNLSTMFDSLRVSLATDGEYAEQINKWLDSKHGDLHSLVKTLEQLESHYTSVTLAKKNALMYGNEAKSQLEWIEKHSALLKETDMDLTDDSATITENLIQERDQDLSRLSNDIITFKQDHVNPLKIQVAELFTATKYGDTDAYSVDGVDTSSLHELLTQVGTGIAQLEHQVSMQSQTLEMAHQYLGWENDLHQLTRNIGLIQEQLYSLISELKSQMAQNDLTTVNLQPLEKSTSSIEIKIKSVAHVVQDLRNQFDNSLQSIIKNQLQPSSANTVCDRLETRLVGVERSFGRCQETLHAKTQELGSLKEQQAWQRQLNIVLNDLDNFNTTVDSFIEHKARWHPDLVISENDEIDLRNTWVDIKANLDEYYQHSVQPLQQEIQAWGSMKQDDESATDWVKKMVNALVDTHKFVEDNLVFGNEIINQRCLMTAFLWRTSQLEHSAEVIREEFLDQSKHGDGDDSDGKLENTDGAGSGLADHGERLQRFNSGIEDLRLHLVPTISLPIRQSFSSASSYLLARAAKSRSTYSDVKDETTNAIIRETIDTRLKRLQDLSNGLQSLLDSKERLTRQEMARVLYKKQLEICKTWIGDQMAKLHMSLKVLDCNGNDVIENKMIDMQQLRGAIGTAESIETATHGSDSVMTSLQTAFKTYNDTFSDDLCEMDENDSCDCRQMETNWSDLQHEASKTTKLLLNALGPAEILNRIIQLQQTIQSLQTDISAKDIASLTDEQITQWQKQIDILDRNNYDTIVQMMTSLDIRETDQSTTATEILSTSPYKQYKLKLQLDQVGETILSTRKSLACLYDVVNLNRLCKTYAENAKVAGPMIDGAQQALLELQQTYQHIDDEAKVDGYRESLLDASQDAKSKTADCKETYDDLCAYSSFIETQKVDTPDGIDLLTEMRATQQSINESWKALQAQGQAIYNLATMASKLTRGYDILTKVEQNVYGLQTEVNHLPSSPPMDVVATLDKKIRDDTASDMAEVHSLLVSLDGEDVTNFGERYRQVASMISDLQQGLDQHKRQFERSRLLQAFSEEVARLQAVCEEQLKFIRQQILANPDLVGKRPESINHISQTYVAAITNIEKVYEKCKDDYQLVLNQEIRLVDYYNVAPSQLEAIKRPLGKSLQDLDTATQTENEYIGALKMVMKHAKTEADLSRSLSEMKSTLLKYAKPSLRTRLHLLPDLQDFNKRNDDLAKSVQLFFSMGDDFKKAKLYKSIGVARTATINKAVDHYQVIIRRMWAEIKVMMDDTKVRLDEMYRRQHGTNKLNEALRYVDDIKERINSLKFSGKSVTVEEGELKDLDREIKVTLTQKIEEMDTLLASISDSDGLIRKQRAQLSTATDQLHHLIQVRQEQAQTEGNISLFLAIIDQLDELILQILVVIENTAPHHAKVIHGKFVKADLQELLRCLVDTYKKNGPQINKLLASAKEEASKQFLDDNNRVAKRLEKTIERWTKTQASATSREKELHTCINALNHEFFTKLALAKKKTSVSVNSKRPGHGTARSSTPVTESSSLSSSSSSSLGSLPPPLGYSSSRRPSFQSSALSVDHRIIGNPGRRSKTPHPTSSGKVRSPYVADPKNELDVQLGRIVNDSAFKVSVKMVSGEVGKYYFGDRLVYCRILPSKMVMVRVGGGWVELSQFLKDHGHKNNNINTSTSTSQTSNQPDQHEDLIPLTESASPSGRIAIRGGGGANLSSSSLNPNHSHSRSSNRSRSPVPSGYMEGDTFIHVGEDGNQVVMKMTKAKEDATTPIKRFS